MLFILVIFFLLAGPLIAIVRAFANVVCRLAAGANCVYGGLPAAATAGAIIAAP